MVMYNMLDIEIGTCNRSAWCVLYLWISFQRTFILHIQGVLISTDDAE